MVISNQGQVQNHLMKMSFLSHINKNYIHTNGFALGTQFKNEAKGNSKMGYWWFTWRSCLGL